MARLLRGLPRLGPAAPGLSVLLALFLGLSGGFFQARAEVPLPSYRVKLGVEAWLQVNAILEEGRALRLAGEPDSVVFARYQAAIQVARRFESQVAATSGLAYLEGLAYRLLGQEQAAEAEYRRSIQLDPSGAVDAWYDLGEILQSRGEWAEADRAFGEVARLFPTGPESWRGPLRRAEVAAWQGDPRRFETHLLEALRRGYRLERVQGEPQWRSFYADTRMRPTLERMILGYGDRRILDQLREP